MGRRDAVPIKKPYPYTIPQSTPLSDAELAESNPSLVLERFRIDGVLRSEKAHRLYQQDGGEAILVRDYCFDWSVLDGKHHGLLRGDTSTGYPMQPVAPNPADDCVENLAENFRWMEPSERESYRRLLVRRLDDASKYPANEIIVAIKRGYEWAAIERRVREDYDIMQANIHDVHSPWPPAAPLDSRIPFAVPSGRAPLPMRLDDEHYELPAVHRRAPHIADPNAWLKYLQCYDLRHCEGLSFGDIASRVYNAPTGRSAQDRTRRQSLYDEAERAFKKVGKLIHAAVSRDWPPHSL